MPRQAWNNASIIKCSEVDGIMRRLIGLGITLPGNITDIRRLPVVTGELMDLAQLVVADDELWRRVPGQVSIEGFNPQQARTHLYHTLNASK